VVRLPQHIDICVSRGPATSSKYALELGVGAVRSHLRRVWQYDSTQGWFWMSSPTGSKWNGTSSTHNVFEVVASGDRVVDHGP